MTTTVAERIEQICRKLGVSKTMLGKLAGAKYPSQSIHNWLTRNSISKSAAAQISALTGFNLQWIINGSGHAYTFPPEGHSSLLSQSEHTLMPSGIRHSDQQQFITLTWFSDDMISIEKKAKLSAANTFMLSFTQQWLQQNNILESAILTFILDDHSLEPLIPNRSLIIVDSSNKRISDGHLYIIHLDDRYQLKRLYHSSDNQIKLTAYRQESPEQSSDNTQMTIIGKVFYYAVVC